MNIIIMSTDGAPLKSSGSWAAAPVAPPPPLNPALCSTAASSRTSNLIDAATSGSSSTFINFSISEVFPFPAALTTSKIQIYQQCCQIASQDSSVDHTIWLQYYQWKLCDSHIFSRHNGFIYNWKAMRVHPTGGNNRLVQFIACLFPDGSCIKQIWG